VAQPLGASDRESFQRHRRPVVLLREDGRTFCVQAVALIAPRQESGSVTTKLNKKALEHARSLVKQGKVVRDERDDWSEAAPSADDENAFLEKHGWAEYAKWHLGEDSEKSEETKGRYTFPYGDLKKVRRGGVISAESRAAQNDYDDIAEATKELLELIDGE
jgi:hypothetical protein